MVTEKQKANLIEIHTRPDFKEITSRGGKTTGARRKAMKEFKMVIKDLLDMPIKNGSVEEFKSLADASGKNITAQQAMVLSVMHKAINGDLQAITFLRDTIGERPTDKAEVVQSVSTTAKLDALVRQLREVNGDE